MTHHGHGLVGRGPLSSGPASAAQEEFAGEVMRHLSPVARERSVSFAEGGTGTLYVNYFNVPRDAAVDGADRENNRLMITVEGFGRGNTLRAELRIRFTQSAFGDAKYKLRTKTAAAGKIAEYVADYINLCAETEPKVRYSPNARGRQDLEPNRYLTRFQLERLLRERSELSSAEISRMTDDQLRRAVGHERLVAAGDINRNGHVAHVRHCAGCSLPENLPDAGPFTLVNDEWICRSCAFYAAEAEKEAAQEREGGHTRNPTAKRQSGPSHYIDHGAPVFIIGDYAERRDGRGAGSVLDIGTTRGRLEYLVKLNNGDRLWFDENELISPSGHAPNARREQADENAARELSLFIENDYALVGAPSSQGKAIERNLLSKIRNGTFDFERSEQAWMYLMETGAKKYAKEFASPSEWSKIFNKPTRELVAHEFAVTFAEEQGVRRK